MMFLILVLAILAVRFYPHREPGFLVAVINNWCAHVNQSAPLGKLGVGKLYVAILVPLIVVFFVIVLCHAVHLSFLAHIVTFLVLVMSFGATDLRERVECYVNDLSRNDVQAAYHDATVLTGMGQESEATTWQQLHRETLGAVTSSYYECYFPIIFWFVVLGAPGAFAYRLIKMLSKSSGDSDRERLSRMKFMLDWLPVRCFALALALVGNFSPVVDQLRKTGLDIKTSTETLLVRLVTAAVHGKNAPEISDTPLLEVVELGELPGLVDRSLVIWIAVIGLIAVV